MASDADDFFEGKRPWSVIKDEVLSSYLPVYLAKVNSMGRPILIVDGFAGPGVFDDGSIGSPLIICASAEKYAKGNYQAFFINKRREHHEKLTSVLAKGNWSGPSVVPILGNTIEILPHLPGAIRNHTVFLYLDPFGPTGSPFSLLEPFLMRNQIYSTELVLMMHMPVIHRLAARVKVEEGRGTDPGIQKTHTRLTDVFGGDYWKPIMFVPDLSAEERENRLINAYMSKLAKYLPYVGSCPVRASQTERIKYFIVFASRHPHAMLEMNQAMAKAYLKYMHETAVAGTLFEKTSWQDERYAVGLRDEVLSQVAKHPGLSRENLWLKVVQANFMRYLEKEYIQTVQQLVDEGALACPTPHPTKRLNKHCELFLPAN